MPIVGTHLIEIHGKIFFGDVGHNPDRIERNVVPLCALSYGSSFHLHRIRTCFAKLRFFRGCRYYAIDG